jgi:hypothetical protein
MNVVQLDDLVDENQFSQSLCTQWWNVDQKTWKEVENDNFEYESSFQARMNHLAEKQPRSITVGNVTFPVTSILYGQKEKIVSQIFSRTRQMDKQPKNGDNKDNTKERKLDLASFFSISTNKVPSDHPLYISSIIELKKSEETVKGNDQLGQMSDYGNRILKQLPHLSYVLGLITNGQHAVIMRIRREFSPHGCRQCDIAQFRHTDISLRAILCRIL